jgi:hypothetical protein
MLPQEIVKQAEEELAAEDRRRQIDEFKKSIREYEGKTLWKKFLNLFPFNITFTWK